MRDSKVERSTLVWKTQHDMGYTDLADAEWLYREWIYPNRFEDVSGKSVLDAGSGPGVQLRMFAEHAKVVVAVDLEALETSIAKSQGLNNVEFIRDDIATMDLGRKFDVVNCVGVIHHTDNPTKTFTNLFRHLEIGGRMIIWAYAKEGNFFMERIIEPLRQRFLINVSHNFLRKISFSLTLFLYIFVNTFYRLPIRRLPYYGYFQNFRKLTFSRNMLNIYDKLNAPQQHFISIGTIRQWFDENHFSEIHISHYAGTSWRASGTKIRQYGK